MHDAEAPLLSDRALKAAAGRYLAQVQGGAAATGNRLLGVFDKWFMRVMARLSAFDQETPWEAAVQQEIAGSPQQAGLAWDLLRLRLFVDRWHQGRLVSYQQRERSGVAYYPGYGTEFGPDVLLTCQGASAIPQWRGLPLMKTVFDLAIYPQLLAELRPRTIFEIGSGSGASAMWLADHVALSAVAGHVHSVDIVKVDRSHPGVTFHQGDCRIPATLFDPAILHAAPHPWLVIEDAHHNVERVLHQFHPWLAKQDYLYVEDSEIKRDDIRRFLAVHPDCYLVDTKYTDFFGRNATCALDSILVRVGD